MITVWTIPFDEIQEELGKGNSKCIVADIKNPPLSKIISWKKKKKKDFDLLLASSLSIRYVGNDNWRIKVRISNETIRIIHNFQYFQNKI